MRDGSPRSIPYASPDTSPEPAVTSRLLVNGAMVAASGLIMFVVGLKTLDWLAYRGLTDLAIMLLAGGAMVYVVGTVFLCTLWAHCGLPSRSSHADTRR